MPNARKFALSALLAGLLCAGPGGVAAPPPASRSGGGDSFSGWTPKDPADAPEYKTPCHMFGAPAEDDAASQFVRAARFEERGSLSSARRAYDALVHNWGDSPEAPEAQLRVARLFEKEGDWEEAFKEYQYYLERFSSANAAGDATYEGIVAAQFACANQLRSQIGSGPFSTSWKLVSAMFRKIARNAPSWDRAPECVFLEARCAEDGGADAQAVPVYERLWAKYPGNALAADALYRAGFCRARLADASPNDWQTLNHALQKLQAARAAAPDHPDSAAALERIGELSRRVSAMEFERAAFYDRVRDNPEAAIIAYELFADRYPAAADAPRARERAAELRAARAAAKD